MKCDDLSSESTHSWHKGSLIYHNNNEIILGLLFYRPSLILQKIHIFLLTEEAFAVALAVAEACAPEESAFATAEASDFADSPLE